MMCLNLFLAMKNYSFLKYDWWAESFTVTVTSFSTVSSFVLFPHWSWDLLLWMSFNWRWWACDLFVIIGGIRRLYRCGIISAERLVHQHVKWFFVCLHWVMCLEDFTCNHQMSVTCLAWTLFLSSVHVGIVCSRLRNLCSAYYLVKICIIHLTFVVLLF